MSLRHSNLRPTALAVAAISFLILALCANAARAEVVIAVGTGNAAPGESVDIPVTFSSDEAVVALQLDISFDAEHLSTGTPVAGDAFGDHQLLSHVSSEGAIRLGVYSPANSALGNGTLFTIPFTVSPAAPDGLFPLVVTAAILSDPGAVGVSPVVLYDGAINGIIFVDGFETGDTSRWSITTGFFPSDRMIAVPINTSRPVWFERDLSRASRTYVAELRLDPHVAILGEGVFLTIFAGYQPSSAEPLFAIDLGRRGGQLVLRARARTGDSTQLQSYDLPIVDGEQGIGIGWWAAADGRRLDGGLNVWLNGQLAVSLDHLANSEHRLVRLRMGAFDASGSDRQGAILLGDYEQIGSPALDTAAQ